MAIITTQEFDGTVNLPSPNEAGKVYEYTFIVDSTADNLTASDFIQLAYVPAEAVITEIIATTDSTTTAVFVIGIANALVTTSVTSLFTTAVLVADTPQSLHVFDDAAVVGRILAVDVNTASESTATAIQFRIRYQAA